MMLYQTGKIVQAFQTQTGAAIAGDWISLKNYKRCCILIAEMRGADATATVFRVDKAKDVSGTDQSTGITMNNFWSMEDLTSVTGDVGAGAPGAADTWTKQTAATSYTGSTTQSVPCYYWIEVDAAELGDPFDCLQVQIVSSNAAHYVTGIYILTEPRYYGETPPSALSD